LPSVGGTCSCQRGTHLSHTKQVMASADERSDIASCAKPHDRGVARYLAGIMIAASVIVAFGCSSAPGPGSSACNMGATASGDPTCVLCSDNLWHCTGQAKGVGECPAAPPSPCISGSSCVTCGSDGMGRLCHPLSFGEGMSEVACQ